MWRDGWLAYTHSSYHTTRYVQSERRRNEEERKKTQEMIIINIKKVRKRGVTEYAVSPSTPSIQLENVLVRATDTSRPCLFTINPFRLCAYWLKLSNATAEPNLWLDAPDRLLVLYSSYVCTMSGALYLAQNIYIYIYFFFWLWTIYQVREILLLWMEARQKRREYKASYVRLLYYYSHSSNQCMSTVRSSPTFYYCYLKTNNPPFPPRSLFV